MTIKSKAFKFLLGIAVVLAVAVTASLANAADFGTATLRVGSRGAAVMEVQKLVGVTADGAYGPMTEAAVKAWQANVGLYADGIFGPASRAKAYELAGSTGTVVTVPGCPAGAVYNNLTGLPCGATTTPTTPVVPGVLQGEEADLTIDADAEDDLVNNKAEQEAFTIEIEADDRGGDARIERMDLTFVITPKNQGTASEGEDDIYDIIEAITLEVDGDEVASVDSDSRSDWDDGQIRLSGLDVVVKSGKTAEIVVLLDIADLDNDDDLDLDIKLSNVEIRYVDAAGIVDIINKNFTEEVTVEAMGAIDFDADETKDNPASVTVSLNEDRDDIVVLVNDIEVDGQDGTIEEAVVLFTLSSFSLADQDALDDLVDEVYLNGDKADDIDWKTTTTFEATFDMDEMEVEVGDEFEVEITVDFKESATTGTLVVTTITFEGEGYDGDDFNEDVKPDGAPTVTLTSGALVLASSEVTGYTAVGSNMQVAKATFEVELENEGDKDISLGVWDTSTSALILTDAFVFEIAGSKVAATDVITGYTVSIKNEGDTLNAANAVIEADESMTYLVTVTIDANALVTGTAEYGIKLADIKYTIDDALATGTYNGDDTGMTLNVNLEAEEIDLINNK